MNRGCLIALEGIDGAGTTSQVAPVASRLRLLGHDVLPTCEPTDGAIGRLLRQCLRAHGSPEEPGEATMALLFAADRLAHLAEIIEPALQRGAIVLTDRYVWSSFAYQSAALPADWVRQINAQARPADLTIYFDLPEATAAARRTSRGGPQERFDNQARQVAAAARYRELVRQGQSAPTPDACEIDASQSVAKVTEQVLAAAMPIVAARRAH